MEEEDVRQAARAIRPHLRELLGSDALATALDERLAELLDEAAAGRQVKAGLLAALSEHGATRSWARDFLRERDPCSAQRSWRPPGDLIGPPAPRWYCPFGDYEWYASTTGERPPEECPKHSVPLVPAG